mmetsp:Transcript_44578/g.127856  ORF Transcript_44578/g.127856 Transcript_44578/m.127856 type:complete len:206 (+) Transcript_44578:1530-2147(+)
MLWRRPIWQRPRQVHDFLRHAAESIEAFDGRERGGHRSLTKAFANGDNALQPVVREGDEGGRSAPYQLVAEHERVHWQKMLPYVLPVARKGTHHAVQKALQQARHDHRPQCHSAQGVGYPVLRQQRQRARGQQPQQRPEELHRRGDAQLVRRAAPGHDTEHLRFQDAANPMGQDRLGLKQLAHKLQNVLRNIRRNVCESRGSVLA